MLRRLVLTDFRNFEKLDVEIPAPGLVIVGENGHGKTNLLEAISYLGLFRSARGSRDVDAIRFGAPAFHVRAELSNVGRMKLHESVSVGFERATKRKKATVDGVEQTKLSAAFGALPSVSFSPADVSLVVGGPAERRHFLDLTLSLAHRWYLQALQNYRGALKQRNAALRVAQRSGLRVTGAHEAQVAVWENSLAKHGAVLAAAREMWCDTYADRFTSLCAAIGERLPVTMRYAAADRHAHEQKLELATSKSSADHTADATAATMNGDVRHALERNFHQLFVKTFDQQRGNEFRRGITLVGPHRDDLQLLLGSRELRTFGSAGQQRTAAIALRMLELVTQEDEGTPPILLLDDPFAELDAKRSNRILALLETIGVGQVIMVVPRDEDIPVAYTRFERRTMVNGTLR